MAIPRPNWKWFIGCFVLALIVAGWGGLQNSAVLALIALLYLPVGIVFALTRDSPEEYLHKWWVVLVGYLIYALLIAFGSKYRSRALLIALVAILAVNVKGCHHLWSALNDLH